MTTKPDELLKRALRGLGRRVLARVKPGARPEGPPFVVFDGRGEGAVPAGTTLLQAAESLRVDLTHYCGGTCSCGTCRVEILEGAHNLSRPEGRERMVLGPVHADRGDRLSCQAQVHGPVRVRIPSYF